MNIHEYQAKEILKNFGLPVLQGKSYSKNLDTLPADIEDLNGPPWVVKSQIHAGGRGAGHFKNSFNDKGGVQVVFEKKDVVVQLGSKALRETLDLSVERNQTIVTLYDDYAAGTVSANATSSVDPITKELTITQIYLCIKA